MDDEKLGISFDPDTVLEIFKLAWLRTSKERDHKVEDEVVDAETGLVVSKKKRVTTANANANAMKLSCELLKLFVTEAIQRAAIIAEAEGATIIEATHLERILPQLLLDF